MSAHDDDMTRTSGPTPTRPATPGPATDPGRLQAGDVVAERFRIVSFLGRGGMGEVYRADDLHLGQSVALKFLPESLASDPKRLELFRSEVRIGREITHPNVCRIHDIQEAGGRIFLSMEYVDGEDLASLLVRIGRLPEDKAVEIGRQLCAGLAAAHERGVIHRDLKPANIMLDGRGRVRITDFGIAAVAEHIGDEGHRVGTPAYMAPELLRGGKASIRSDVYALGLVLYELFTGKPPFKADNERELLAMQTSSQVTSPADYVIDLDRTVEQAILRCLDADPEERPGSALAVAMALPGGDPLQAALAAGETPSPQMVAAMQGKRRHPAITAALALAALLAIGFFARMTAERSVLEYAPLDRHPIALIDAAGDMLDDLGFAEPVETAWGYGIVEAYLRWLIDEREEDHWEAVRQPRPSATYFWMRRTPIAWGYDGLDFDRGIVTQSTPTRGIAGEVYIALDPDGRLRRLYAIPEWQTRDVGAPSPDETAVADETIFTRLFDLAELDPAAFEPIEPRFETPYRTHHRRAWTGTYPEAPEIPVRIEAGSADGRVVYFRLVPPWEEPSDEEADATPDPPPTLFDRIRAGLRVVNGLNLPVTILLLFVSGYLAARNLRSSRSDTAGAGRVALFAGVVTALAKWVSGNSLFTRGQFELLDIFAWGVFMGAGSWVLYIAIEPVVRRNWPRVLVSWTRLLRGQLRDPAVGHSILTGLALGAAFALVHRGVFLAASDTPWADVWYRQIPSYRHLDYVSLLIFLAVPLIQVFINVLILVGLLRLTRKPWLAATLLVPVIALFSDHLVNHSWSPLIVIVYAGLSVLALLRTGVLTLVVAQFTVMAVYDVTWTFQLGSWFAHQTIVGTAMLAALLLWGIVASTARERSVDDLLKPTH